MRRLPPLSAIEAAVAVARTGSVKGAAEALAISAPATTRRIQTLERFVGRPLFDRRHQAIAPNAEGERLLAALAPAVDELGEIVARSMASATLLRLRLGVLPLFASQRLFPKLSDLRAREPELHLDIDTAPQPLSRLGDGLDAAIVLGDSIDPAFHSVRLTYDRMSLIADADHARRFTRPSDIHDATVLLHREMEGLFDMWCETVGEPDLRPIATDLFDSGPLMLEAAARGIGVAFMLDSHLDGAHDDRLHRLFGTTIDSPVGYWFACRPRALTQRPVRAFHDWLVQAEL